MFWKKKEPEILYGEYGQVLPCHDPETAVVIPTPSTLQPPDKITYGWGRACENEHWRDFQSGPVDLVERTVICETCGELTKLAVIKATESYRWGPNYGFLGTRAPVWQWIGRWESTEFVRFLYD